MNVDSGLKFVGGFAMGAVAAGVLAAFVGGFATSLISKKVSFDARAGSVVVPVIAAARDLAPGERLDDQSITLRSLPESWAKSGALATAESVQYLRDQPLAVPVAKGDPIRWVNLELVPDSIREAELTAACGRSRPPSDGDPAATVEAVRASIVGGGR